MSTVLHHQVYIDCAHYVSSSVLWVILYYVLLHYVVHCLAN